MQNPFLHQEPDIRWSQLTPEHVQPDIEKALEEAQANIDAIAGQDPDQATFTSTFEALEDATERLGRAWGLVAHLDSVMNSEELRAPFNAMIPKVAAFHAAIHLNGKLWNVLKAVAERLSAQPDPLSEPARRLMSETVADFREAGADLPQEKKDRLAAIQQELAEKTQKFSENVLDATKAFERIITDESRLAGLPEDAKESARLDALKKGHGSEEKPAWRFTLHMPSYLPVMRYVDDEALREELYKAQSNRAYDGDYDNTNLIREILQLRAEKAKLLGKTNFADVVLERRMARSGIGALDFVEDLHKKTKAAFDRENEELEDFKARKTGEPKGPLFPWESMYWSEKMRQELFDFDEEVLRPYFPIDSVQTGLFDLSERLFGIRISERSGDEKPEVWHEEVRFFDIFDSASGQLLGSFYTDWFPRDSKRGGAWMNHLITGERKPGQPWTPHIGLICGNLNPPVGSKPALLNHRDVETLFHEFGHLIHHLLSDVPYRSLAGIHVAWDFVELPSQIMENWCWERESLDLFARHYETGEPIPGELFERLLKTRKFHAARMQMRQLQFSRTDLEMHLRPESFLTGDLDEVLDALLEDYHVPAPVPVRSIVRYFDHLFGDPTGYAAGYYSYKWAEVLDADAFTRFAKEGILNAETGRSFRKEILSQGSIREPGELYRAFMGRDPDPQALLVRFGLA